MTDFNYIFKKAVGFVCFFVFSSVLGFSQVSIYQPDADLKKEFAQARERAIKEKKHIIIQVGGNWCGWCIKFHKYIHETPKIDSALNADYVYMLANYSPQNKNEEFLNAMGKPQRFGFPVFLVCDSEGNLIHTQDSWYLEDGKGGYELDKVLAFLKNWSPKNYTKPVKIE